MSERKINLEEIFENNYDYKTMADRSVMSKERFMDVCLELNGSDDGFNIIRKMKSELKAKSKEISVEEFHTQEADIFYEYLRLVGAVS